ncbi:hypothetical protein BDL97_08G129000 [Sphagnum fallax]|nr:hypothetical protein BDL97_08G129000 [Sphagnum fallax]
MGRCPNHKNSHGKHYSHKTARRAKFLVKGDDLIHTELRKVDVPRTQEPNSDLPGLGQFYCLHCEVKMMDGAAPHNQIDAEVAAGMGRPDNGPRLQVEDPAMTL